MNWRTRIDPELRGSYRGVEFFVERADATHGRRWLVHEYPRRDVPYAEDMGRRAKEWRLSLFVAGDDYDLQRDKLVKALDAPGSATLVHPYLGTMSAVGTDVRTSESTREGGVCIFEVTFSESGEQLQPGTTVDTQRKVGEAADELEAQAEQDFWDRWSIKGLTGWSLEEIQRDLASAIDGIEQFVGGLADEIAAVIRFPANITGLILGGYNRLRNAVMRPVNALDLYSGRSPLSASRVRLNLTGSSTRSSRASSTFGTGTSANNGSGGNGLGTGLGSVATSGSSSFTSADTDVVGAMRLTPGTPTRAVRMLRTAGTATTSQAIVTRDAQRLTNLVAAEQLNGRLAAVTAARVVAETDWLSRYDAEAAGKDVLELIDLQMQTVEPVADAVYNALVVLRAAVSTDLRTRALALPNMSEYTPQATLPAVVIAHRLYGDANRADEICVRNNVRHPGALRGGVTLEVLSE